MQSGSGKTVITCALLRAFQGRGERPCAFKCGPDYIDPMFLREVSGLPCRNLDTFLQGDEGVLESLALHGDSCAVIESAMGFYDGEGGTAQGSAWDIAGLTGTPVLLIVRPSGASLTLAAMIRGIQIFRAESHLSAILINDCSPALYEQLKIAIETETGLPVAGYLPHMKEAELPGRHLGLLTAPEITDLRARVDAVAAQLEKTADLSLILKAADEASDLPQLKSGAHTVDYPQDADVMESGISLETEDSGDGHRRFGTLMKVQPCIAAAFDEAFCFYYEDSLDALEHAGARICVFSPLRDETLPEGTDALYLGGGYPELYAESLSMNTSMRESVCHAVKNGLPTVAECGGFLYLQKVLKDSDGISWPMAGVLPGESSDAGRLKRFGYVNLSAGSDSLLFRAGEVIPAHEFHHWESTECGKDLSAVKPFSGQNWKCGVTTPSLYAGFPHLCLSGRIPLAQRFVMTAAAYADRKTQARI